MSKKANELENLIEILIIKYELAAVVLKNNCVEIKGKYWRNRGFFGAYESNFRKIND